MMRCCGTYIFSGLFTQGVLDGGHEVVAHLEDGDFGVLTSKLNWPNMAHFVIRDRWPRAHLKDMELDFLYGNPPCAGFSMASRNRGADNPLNAHLGHANQLGWDIRPKAFAVESVTQMFQTGDEIVSEWERQWHDIGYQTCRLWENSGHLGLPQERKRAIFVAAKANLDFSYPREKSAATVRDAIYDLKDVPAVEKGRFTPQPQPYAAFATTAFQAMARLNSSQVTWHCYQKMNRGLGTLLPHLEPGKRVRSISDAIYEETYWKEGVGAERHRGGKPSFLVARLNWDRPSSVITGGITYVHPEHDRFLTVRECARLMGLPDRFDFSNSAHAYAEIGKAVSPYVGKWLSGQISDILQDPQGRVHKSEVKLL
jgi:DNA (cytosine-5)-methyltransferase 1